MSTSALTAYQAAPRPKCHASSRWSERASSHLHQRQATAFHLNLMYCLKPLAHKLERIAETLFQRSVKPFIYGLTYFVQFGSIVALQISQLALKGVTHFAQPPFVRVGERLYLGKQRLRKLIDIP